MAEARYRPLGAFRLLLALMVVCQHQLHLLAPAAREVFYDLELGVVAVAVFFAVSGFVVAEALATFYRGRAGAFLANRALRLLPCYLAALALAALAQAWLHASGRFVPLDGALAGSPVRPAILLSGVLEILPGVQPRYLLGTDFSLVPFAWTLRVESAFYAAAFLVCLAGARPRAAAGLALGAGYLLFAWRVAHGAGPQQILYVPFFLFGIVLFHWRRAGSLGAGLHALAALGCVLVAFPLWMQRGHPIPALQMGLLLALLGGFAALTGCALPERWRRRDRQAGDLSYPLYVGHGVILLLLADGLAARGFVPYAAGLVLSAGLAAGLHGAVEAPMRRLRDRVRGARLTGEAPALRQVLVLAGGALAHTSGGVGTLLRHVLQAVSEHEGAPRMRVVDTRGPGGRLSGVLWFARALWLTLVTPADLVHLHMTTRGSVLRKCLLCAAAGMRRRPFIVHMHGADFGAFYATLPRLLQRALVAVLRRAASVIVLGSAWRGYLVGELGLAPARVALVPNAVPPGPAPAAAGGTPEILFLGRIGARKGVPELIDALATPAMRGLAWHATLAGDGDCAPYRARVAALGLGGRVAFPGWVGRAEADALLARASLLVLPSHHEAMPMAVLEALASGVPVVTTPVGALPEYLRDGVSARFVPPGSAPLLAAALAGLLLDPPARAELGRGGRAAFAAMLSIDAVASRMLALYRAALA